MKIPSAFFVSLSMSVLNLHADELRNFPIPASKVGKLEMKIPRNWTAKTNTTDSIPSIEFSGVGPRFSMLISYFENRKRVGPNALKKIQTAQLNKFKDNAEEANPEIESFNGEQSRGWKYSLSDKKPDPAGFKYLTQGALLIGENIITFTILRDEKTGKSLDECIASLQSISIQQSSESNTKNSLKLAQDVFFKQDYKTSYGIWEPFAKSGNPDAMLGLGKLYSVGYGVKQDPQEALYWLFQARAEGNFEALFLCEILEYALSTEIADAAKHRADLAWEARHPK